MKKHPDEWIGEWAAIGHMMLDGFWPVGANYGVQFLPPTEVLGIATFVSGVFFLILTLRKGQIRQLFHWRILAGCTLYTALLLLPYVAIFYATQHTSAINTALFTQSEVIFAAFVGWLILKEKPQLYRWLGIFFVLVANLVALYQGGIKVNPADLILVSVPIFFVFGNATAKRLQATGLGYAPLLLFRGAVGGGTLLLFSLLLEPFKIPAPSLWPFLLIFGLFAFSIPKALWQISLQKTDLSKTSAIGLSYPVISFIIAYFWLGETPTIYQMSALLISFVGIYFLMQTHSRRNAELAAAPD
jgi:drug/metabolite transporter (DMT)-like permease